MKKLENKKMIHSPFSYHFEDGLLDMFIGTIILQLGMTLLFTQLNIFGDAAPLISFLICLVLYIAIILIWKYFTLPKLANTAFTPVKKKNFRFFFMFNALFFMVILIAAALFTQRFSQANLFRQSLLRVLPMVIVLGLGAYLLELSRIFLYAALVVFAFPFGGYLAILVGWPFLQPVLILASSLGIITIGLVLCIRFFRRF